jgi:hypothetical protein
MSIKPNNQETTKSPIKDKPLRYAGESLDKEIDELMSEEVGAFLAVAFCFIAIAAYEWWKSYFNVPPMPKVMTFVAVFAVLFIIFKITKLRKQVKAIRLGRDGERIVGEYLDGLREDGHRVFHDLLGDNFNLDHVIVSTKGIFVIETKTYSKPVKGDAKIQYDGEKIIVAGRNATKDPITQVTAASKWLKNILKESTGKEYMIKPVVVFPGWFVETNKSVGQSNVWVLNPKALQSFISNENDKITREDMMLATFHLSRYIRSKAA